MTEQLRLLEDGGVGVDDKIRALDDVRKFNRQMVTEFFEPLWSTISGYVAGSDQPFALRMAALRASVALLQVCTTQDLLVAFTTSFSAYAKVLFDWHMDRLSNAFGDRHAVLVPNPKDLLSHLGEQRKSVAFFSECTKAMAAISLEHESTALDPLIEHFFSVINPAAVRSSEIIPKLAPAGIVGPEAVKIGQEANALFTDALGTLSPFVTAYLKLFPPTAPPSQGVACDDPKITRILQHLVSISEKSGKNIKAQTAVWKLIRVLVHAHAHRVQNSSLVSKIIMMGVSKAQLSWNAAIVSVPRMAQSQGSAELVATGDERGFENKINASRFLWAVLGLLCRHYAPLCAPYFSKLSSLVIMIGRQLADDSNKPGGLTRTIYLQLLTRMSFNSFIHYVAPAYQKVSHIHKSACGCLRALFCSSALPDDKKISLLNLFAIRGGEDPLSYPKLQALLYLFQNLPPSALFPSSAETLYWVANGVEACASEVLLQGLDSVTVPTSAFIYALSLRDPQALEEVECFIFQHLFHPHFLCSQLAAELHCFILHNADEALQRRHVMLLANLVRKGGTNVVDSLAPLLPQIVNSLTTTNKELLLRQFADDLVTDGYSAEETVLYRLAAFLPAWTPSFPSEPTQTKPPLTLGVESLLSNITKSCLRLFTSHSSSTPQLISVARCLGILLTCDQLPERDTAARAVLNSLGDLLQLVTEEPTKYNAPLLLPYLIDLSVLIPAFSPDLLPNFLVGYGQVMSSFPSTRLAVAQLLSRCNIKMRADMQERVLRSCAGLYQQLLADGEWSVCAGAMQSFQHFVQFMPYPVESIQGLLSSECRAILINYLSGKPIALARDQQPMSDVQLCDLIGSELSTSVKEQLAQAQGTMVGSSSHQEGLVKAQSLLAQASAILSALPPSALSHVPHLHAQINQLARFLPSPSSSSSSSSALDPHSNGHPSSSSSSSSSHPIIHLS